MSHNKERFWKEFHLEFARRAPHHNVSKSYQRKFAKRWVNSFSSLGHVFERVRRKPNMRREEVQRIGELLMKGYKVKITVQKLKGRGANKWQEPVREERQRYYRSIKEFVERNPEVLESMNRCHITSTQTLRRLLRQHCPRLRRGVHHPRAPLNEVQKRDRNKCVYRLLFKVGTFVMPGLDLLLHMLYRVCWIDSKKYYIFPRGQKVWAPAGADMTDPDPRLKQGVTGKTWLCVNYYVVVNAILGCVYFEYVYGTTAHEEDPNYEEYTVSSSPTPTPHPSTVHKSWCKLSLPGFPRLSAPRLPTPVGLHNASEQASGQPSGILHPHACPTPIGHELACHSSSHENAGGHLFQLLCPSAPETSQTACAALAEAGLQMLPALAPKPIAVQ